jgi:hypothetical protein
MPLLFNGCMPKQLMNQMMIWPFLMTIMMMKMTFTLMMELLHQLLLWYKSREMMNSLYEHLIAFTLLHCVRIIKI